MTLRFTTDDDELQDFLDTVKENGLLNSRDNEEGAMIRISNFQYRTDIEIPTWDHSYCKPGKPCKAGTTIKAE